MRSIVDGQGVLSEWAGVTSGKGHHDQRILCGIARWFYSSDYLLLAASKNNDDDECTYKHHVQASGTPPHPTLSQRCCDQAARAGYPHAGERRKKKPHSPIIVVCRAELLQYACPDRRTQNTRNGKTCGKWILPFCGMSSTHGHVRVPAAYVWPSCRGLPGAMHVRRPETRSSGAWDSSSKK
jgi:hypothetical protein